MAKLLLQLWFTLPLQIFLIYHFSASSFLSCKGKVVSVLWRHRKIRTQLVLVKFLVQMDNLLFPQGRHQYGSHLKLSQHNACAKIEELWRTGVALFKWWPPEVRSVQLTHPTAHRRRLPVVDTITRFPEDLQEEHVQQNASEIAPGVRKGWGKQACPGWSKSFDGMKQQPYSTWIALWHLSIASITLSAETAHLIPRDSISQRSSGILLHMSLPYCVIRKDSTSSGWWGSWRCLPQSVVHQREVWAKKKAGPLTNLSLIPITSSTEEIVFVRSSVCVCVPCHIPACIIQTWKETNSYDFIQRFTS